MTAVQETNFEAAIFIAFVHDIIFKSTIGRIVAVYTSFFAKKKKKMWQFLRQYQTSIHPCRIENRGMFIDFSKFLLERSPNEENKTLIDDDIPMP